MAKTIFHIGLHKTGTTFLQKNVFPFLYGIHAHIYYQPLWNLFEFDKKVIVSCERFSGHPFSGKWSEEFATYVKNIGSMFPGAKCIVGFRRHDMILRSLYKLYLHRGSYKNVETVFDPDGSGLITPIDLCFQKRIEQCEQHFADVFVYTQEELRDNLGSFLNRLSQFLGTPPPSQPTKSTRQSETSECEHKSKFNCSAL